MTKQQMGTLVLTQRKAQGLSQKQLAEKAGLKRYQHVMEVEKALTDYGVDVLIKIADALKLEVIINNPGWEQQANKEVEEVQFDFRNVESLKEEKVGKVQKKTVSLPFKRKK